MPKYVLSVDQSTQGTKALILDGKGNILARADLAHRQIISKEGWVSHDLTEIYENVLKTARTAAEKAGIDPSDIVCLGISNQRETTAAWDRETGRPVCGAVVWQCARAAEMCAEIAGDGSGTAVRERSGIPVSPYFPAAKMAWILRNVPEARALADKGRLCLGTMDAWLVWKLTGQYKTDYSNASRTQLFNIRTLEWDGELCSLFGIDPLCLPEVTDSDAVFGETDLGGWLDRPIPVCGVLGDSHGALFGQGCVSEGMAKATYGTGSSIMMNIGSRFILSDTGVVTSLAWKAGGRINYVLEGNVNYTGAVISWLKDDLKLIQSPMETETLARQANPNDTTYLVPAFSGLGAPYWDSSAKAIICGMSRTTGRREIVRAALDSIALQIMDVVLAMKKSAEMPVPELRADGGPTRNGYLMHFQSDILDIPVRVPEAEELSGLGAGWMAGIALGLYPAGIQDSLRRRDYIPHMSEEVRNEKRAGWLDAVNRARNG